MKRKILLIISITIIFCLIGVAIFLVYKFGINKINTKSTDIKNNTTTYDEKVTTTSDDITTIDLNLYLFGNNYNINTLDNENYIFNFSNDNIIEIINNSIKPINSGSCVLTIKDNSNKVKCIYKIKVFNEILFDTNLTENAYVGENYYFKYITNNSLKDIDITTNLTSSIKDNITTNYSGYEKDNKEIKIDFSFNKTENINNCVIINSIFEFDNYIYEVENTINFYLFNKINKFEVTYFGNGFETINNINLINNEYYFNSANDDGNYTFLLCKVSTNELVNYKIKIENNSDDLISLFDENKNEISELTTLNSFYIYPKGNEGTASFTITDLTYNFTKTFSVHINKLYATNYDFNISDGFECYCGESIDLILENITPIYSFSQEYNIEVDTNYIEVFNNTLYFKKAGDTYINIYINSTLVNSINIKIKQNNTYTCSIASLSLEDVNINNEAKTITITNFAINKNIILNCLIKYNSVVVSNENIQFVYDESIMSLSYLDYPSISLTLKNTGSTFIKFKFYDIEVTYNLYIS